MRPQWFDYATTPPTLNIARRGDGVPVSIVAFAGEGEDYDGPVDSVEINPRYDLVVPAVVIKYRKGGWRKPPRHHQ